MTTSRLNRAFALRAHGTTVRREVLAGVTTFLAMAYIIFVQPAILSGGLFGVSTGMDPGAVTVATCLSAAFATALMGWRARLPVALAPGMGQNVFFVFGVTLPLAAAGVPDAWRVALGLVFVSGVLFFLLTLLGAREALLASMSPNLRRAVPVGIGLFIAFIGLKNAGIIVEQPGTAVRLNPDLLNPDTFVFTVGLLTAAVLQARRVPGAILLGIAASLAAAAATRAVLPFLPEFMAAAPATAGSKLMTSFTLGGGVVSAPPSLSPTWLKLDLRGALAISFVPLVLIFLFMDVFDTMGTLVGVTERAGLSRRGRIPRLRQAMLADASGTVVGACLGTSTVTSYIESAAGVEQGGRTGLTALVVAALFLAATAFSPLIALVGGYPPITAPALVVVGALMAGGLGTIDWRDFGEAFPAFLVIVGIPLTFSIADGLAFGFISYPCVKWASGRGRQVTPLMWGMAVALVAYFALVRNFRA